MTSSAGHEVTWWGDVTVNCWEYSAVIMTRLSRWHLHLQLQYQQQSMYRSVIPQTTNGYIGAGTIFRLGSENWWKTIKTIKYGKLWGLGKAQEAEELSIIFVLNVTSQSVRLLLTVSYRKIAEQNVLAPPVILLGSNRSPCSCAHELLSGVIHSQWRRHDLVSSTGT